MSLRRRLNLPRWRFRILMEPVATGGGGTGNAPPAEPPAAPPATPPAPPPAEPPATPPPVVSGVTLTVEQYNALKAKEVVADAAEAERVRLAKVADDAALAAAKAKGDAIEAERLLNERHTKEIKTANDATAAALATASQAERDSLSSQVDIAISEALATRTLLGPAQVAQVKFLLKPLLEASKDASGVITVKQKGGAKDAATFLKETLDSADYAPFHKAGNPGGGTGGGGGSRSAGTGLTPDQQAAIDRHKASINPAGQKEYIGFSVGTN